MKILIFFEIACIVIAYRPFRLFVSFRISVWPLSVMTTFRTKLEVSALTQISWCILEENVQSFLRCSPTQKTKCPIPGKQTIFFTKTFKLARYYTAWVAHVNCNKQIYASYFLQKWVGMIFRMIFFQFLLLKQMLHLGPVVLGKLDSLGSDSWIDASDRTYIQLRTFFDSEYR